MINKYFKIRLSLEYSSDNYCVILLFIVLIIREWSLLPNLVLTKKLFDILILQNSLYLLLMCLDKNFLFDRIFGG